MRVSSRKRQQIQQAAEPGERSYYALTQSQDEVDEGLRLRDELTAAKDALAELEAQRATVDESLAVLAQEADFRRQRREELVGQRDEAASRADLDAVAEASRLIDATERIDAARGVIAQQRRHALADLDAKVQAAREAVAGAEAKVAEHKEATAGRYPRFLVDHHVRHQILRFAAGESDTVDSVALTEVLAALPDLTAEAVAKDPKTYIDLYRADRAPKPEPKPTFEQAKAMVEEGQRLIREYAYERDQYWRAVAARPPAAPLVTAAEEGN